MYVKSLGGTEGLCSRKPVFSMSQTHIDILETLPIESFVVIQIVWIVESTSVGHSIHLHDRLIYLPEISAYSY